MTEINTDAIIKNHNTQGERGRFAEEGAVANMVEDAYKILKKHDIDGDVQQHSIDKVTKELKEDLSKFGVTGLSVVDSNHNNKIDKGDQIHVRVKELVKEPNAIYIGNVEHTLTLGQKHKETPKPVVTPEVKPENKPGKLPELTIGSGAAHSDGESSFKKYDH